MGLHLPRRGFGALEQTRDAFASDYASDYAADEPTGEAFAEGMFNTVEGEFYTYEGDPLPEPEEDAIGSSMLGIGVPALGLEYLAEDAATTQDPIVIGSTIGGVGGGSSSVVDSSDADLAAAYRYGYERGQADKISGKPNDPTAAVDTVTASAPSSAIGVLTTATRTGYADGYSGAADQTKDPAKVDPKAKGLKTDPAVAEGMSTGTMVAIGAGLAAVVGLAVVASKKRGR